MKILFANSIQNPSSGLLLAIILALFTSVPSKADLHLNDNFSVSSWIADFSADISNSFEKHSFQELNNPNQLNLVKTDHILYYELLDQWFTFDLGISLVNFDGNIHTESATSNYYHDFDIEVPTSYGKIQFNSSMTGVSIGLEASLFSFGQHSVSDYKVYLGWQTYSKIQFEMGYKSFALDYNDIKIANDIQIFDGLYTSFYLPF